MTTFDDLPDELVEYIYKLVHKSRIENVHKELHSAFQGLYIKHFLELKSEELYNDDDFDWWSWRDVEEDANDEYPCVEGISNILYFDLIHYLMNNCSYDDGYKDPESWFNN